MVLFHVGTLPMSWEPVLLHELPFTVWTLQETHTANTHLPVNCCFQGPQWQPPLLLAIGLHIQNVLINSTYFKYKLISKKSIFKNDIESKSEIWLSLLHFAFFWLVLMWPHRKQDISQWLSDWFILTLISSLKRSWIGSFGSTYQTLDFYNYSCQVQVYVLLYCFKMRKWNLDYNKSS